MKKLQGILSRLQESSRFFALIWWESTRCCTILVRLRDPARFRRRR